MSLSWLGFGRKKSAQETDSPSNSKPEGQQDNEDFVLVESGSKRQDHMYPNLGGLGPGPLPYQIQPYTRDSQGSNTTTGTEALSLIPSNPLDDVPFKLSSRLDLNSCGWTASDVAHFKSLLSRVDNLNENVFKYDFSNEESVIKEENQQARDSG